MDITADRIITAPVSKFSILSGLGRSRIYELISAGEIDSILVGKRRLVVVDSWRRRVACKLAEEGDRKLPRPGQRTAP